MKISVWTAIIALFISSACSISKLAETYDDSDTCESMEDDCLTSDNAVMAAATDSFEESEIDQTDSAALSVTDTETAGPCAVASDCLKYVWYPTPHATEWVHLALILNFSESYSTSAFDPDEPGVTTRFSTAIIVYDSLGSQHRLDIYFRPGEPNGIEWDYYIVSDGGDLTNGTPGVNELVGAGTLQFATDGSLADNNVWMESFIDFQTAAQQQRIEFHFGELVPNNDTAQYAATSLAATSRIIYQLQNGHDGSGNWECVHNQCEQVMGFCGIEPIGACCGDNTCKSVDGKDAHTCAVDCD